MRPIRFPPFPDLSDEPSSAADGGEPAIMAEAWQLADGDLREPEVSGWDYLRNLEFRRTVTLDLQQIRERCQLGRDARVRLTVLWTTGAGYDIQHRGWTERVHLQGDARRRLDIVQPVLGADLASAVSLSTVLVMEERGHGAAPVAATQPGSVLWTDDEVSLVLEGRGAKMPTVFMDFKSAFGAAQDKAAWSVFTTGYWLSQHPSIGVQVRINRNRPEIEASITARPGTDKDKAVKSMLYFDVGRCLIGRALDDPDFGDDSEFPPGTTGASLRHRLTLLFPNETVDQVRGLRKDNPEKYERAIQAGHRLLEDVT